MGVDEKIFTRDFKPEKFTRESKIESINNDSSKDSRSIEFSFSSEEPVKRWFGDEILEHKSGSVDLQRMKDTGTLLFNHNRDYVLGRIDDLWLDETSKTCRAKVTFDEDDDADKIYKKVKSGSIRGVSFGYKAKEAVDILNENIRTGRKITSWEPYEISIVAIPADTTVGVGRSEESTEENEKEGKENMDENNKKDEKEKEEKQNVNKKSEDEKADKDNDNEEEKDNENEESDSKKKTINNDKKGNSGMGDKEKTAAEKEKKRCLEVTKLCREYNVGDEDAERFLTNGTGADEVRAFILDGMKETNKPITSRIIVTETGRDEFKRNMSDSLILRAGIDLGERNIEAEKLTGIGFRDIAIQALRMENVDASRMGNDELFRRALTPGSAFASVMDDTVNKSMLKAYQTSPTTFQEWTATGSQTNFKDATHYQISEAGELKQINENGEFTFDEMKDSKVKTSVATFGKGFGLTRTALINDDLDMLTRIPQAYVRACYRGINKLVYSILTGNNKIYDGKTLFDESHKNNATVKGAPSVATLGNMRMLMRTQKNIRGKETLNIPLKYILVPAALETEAEQLINSTADPAGQNSGVVNPFRNKIKIIAEPELDVNSAEAWYGIADPRVVETIMVSYLNGKKTPTLESQVQFDTLGIKYRIFMDYGVDVVDYRGAVKNEGKGK